MLYDFILDLTTIIVFCRYFNQYIGYINKYYKKLDKKHLHTVNEWIGVMSYIYCKKIYKTKNINNHLVDYQKM